MSAAPTVARACASCRAALPCAAHSDPDALRAAAAEARAGAEARSPEFQEKQARVAALLEAMQGEPTEAELMQVLGGVG